ncbi:hypothetical protein [Mycolicibacterium wolinskyi]|uniref:hypothetical protein n=1 Tax=Mycolicibacterium wolinskyi TaxID=59750 RepID=UPI0039176B82
MTEQPEQSAESDETVVEGEVVPPATGSIPTPTSHSPETGYTPAGVPTFESVREKIETRYGTSIGASELAADTPEGRAVEEQYDARQRAAAERLKQIRQSMRDDDSEKS